MGETGRAWLAAQPESAAGERRTIQDDEQPQSAQIAVL